MTSLRTLPRIAAWLGFGAAALVAGTAQAAQGDNIALGKPVTMSGTTSDPTLVGANCTDGNRNGNHPTDGICWTGATQTGANREWIEVDLGQDYIIDRVRLSNRTDGSNGDLSRWLAVTTRPSSLTGVTSDPLSTLNSALNPNAPFVNKIAYGAGTSTAGGIYGTGQGDPWTSLDMKVGTHIARYVRIYTMKANTVLNLAEIEVFEGAPPSRSIVNPSFEQPGINAGGNAQIAETLVPGWSTTEPVAVPNAGFGTAFLTGGNIEMWNTGFGGVTADAGSQFVELNAFNNGTLSPAPLCVYPGETFSWRVSHRARGAAGVTDVARLRINGQDIATFRDGVTQADEHTCAPAAGFNCTAQAGSPTATGWGRWQGNWTNTQPQPKAMTFEFAAISSSGGSGYGNFIDNVSVTGLTAAVEFSAGAATGPESVATANLPKLLVNGPVTAGQTIELQIVGGSATRGGDYTTNPASGTIVVTIPAGTYDGTAATAISLAPYLQIVTDSAVEGAETIVLRLANASAGLSIAGASGCRTGVADSTYTITDEAVPTIGKRFAPDTIPYGGSTTLTFTVDNSGAGAIDRPIAFTDNLATGLQIAAPSNASTTCGGTIAAAPGDNRIVFSGGNVPAGGFCTVSVNITNRPGFSGLCYNPNFANENQNLVGLQNLIAQIEQYTCVSVTPPDCPDSAVTNGFGNISGLSPNLNNGISGQCVAVMPTIELIKVSEGGVGSFGFGLTNTNAPNPAAVTTTAPGAPGTSAGVFDVLDLAQPVTVAESALPAGWTLSDVACQLRDGTPIGNFDATGGILTIAPGDLAYGQQITCTATNLSPANVVVSKTLSAESGSRSGQAEAGEQLTYTITLTNSGNNAATNYGVTDTLDPNVVFVSASNGGAAAGGAVTWSGLTVPANGTLSLTVVVQVADPIPAGVTQIGNVAYETGTTPPACPPAGGQCVVVPTAPKVAIVKRLVDENGSLPGFAEAGEQLTYTITLSNSGGSAATGYGVTDTLDPNVAFVSADNGGVASGAAVTWSGLSVPAGGSLTLTVVVQVVDPLPPGVTQVGNVAYETGTTPPACPPAGGQCVIVPTIHPPLACSEQDARATERWWFFGTRAGIDFGVSGTAATAVLNPGNIVTPEGSTVVTDTAGQLQFWSNAKVAYTRNQTPMPNGSGLLGNDSATQTVAAFPAIGHPGRYFIVTTDTDVGSAPNGQLRYSVVDMTLNGGLGDIVAGQKNLPLGAPGTASESLTAVPNADGTGFWVLTATNNAPTLLAYAFDDNGPVGAPVASALSTSNGRWYGSLYFNKKLNQLVQATSDNPGSGQLRVLTFDGATGQAFERFTWRPGVTGVPAGSVLYTADFSPAGDYVYATRIFSGGRLYRYRIAGANTAADVLATEEFLGATGSNQGGHVRRGADDRMYIPGNIGGTSLNVVNTPDDASAGYVAGGYPLAAGASTSFGLPQTVTGCPLPTAADVSIAKTASAPAPTGTPNQYAITYVVTASNVGGSTGSYDLADTLSFNGATVTAVGTPVHASSTGDTQDGTPGTFGAPAGGTIVSGETIASGGVETWTYVVTYTITDADVAADCSTPGGGLRNHAALGGASAGAPPADTCSGAPSVSVVKTATAPVPTGATNEFAMTYTVAVSNSGSLAGVYDLSDTLSFNGATVSAISAPAYASSTGDTQTGTLGAFAAPNGGTIVSGESLAAGGAETWTYTVTYTVTDAATAQDCANPSGGLRNRAQLGGSLVGESTTCTGAPAVVIGKSAGGPVPTGNANEYALDYLVTAQNNGTLPGIYDLADTFTFAGVTVVSVSPVTHGGGDPLATTPGTLTATGGTIVTGETIAAGASETYAYRVVFRIDDVAAVGTCAAGGGLKNQAALGGSSSGQVGTCSDVPAIAISKTAGAPTPTGTPHQYTTTYTVTVNNAGAAAGSYDLSDAFAFAGATIDAVGAVAHGGSDPLATPLGTLTATGGTIVTGETIAASANETYTYTVTFTVTDAAAAADCTAPAGGLRNRAALGGSASGDAAVCTSAPNVAVAKALTGESGALAGQAEAGEQLTYTITLTNSGGSAATGYGVTDTLDPNVTFVSADNGGSAAAGVVTWSGLTVPANGSLTLTVVVQVVDPIPAGVAQIGNVAYETGTTPPTCPPAGGQCVVVPTAPSVTLAKTLTAESGSRPGEAEAGEQLTYTITLTNTGGSAAVNYGVTDTLDPNVTFVSASNGGSAAGGAVTWSGLTVPANGSLTLTVVVQVVDPIPAGVTQIGNVAYETGTTPPACPPAGGQCVVVPTAPKLALNKSAGAPTPTGAPNQYAITYVVTVRNDGGSVGSYDLADTLTFNGATVTAISAPVYAGSAGEVQDGVLGGIGAPSGGSIVGNERIGALGTESWTYTVTYTVDDADLAADCAAPNGGLRNQAALGGAASGTPSAGTCTGAPSVSIVKTASAPVPTGSPNQFTLTYVVDVANTGSLPGSYDLADTLSFNGATVDTISTPAYGSGSGDTQDGTPGTFAAPDGGTIVTGEAISAGGTESWTYLVTYTVTDPATAQDCANPSGGLRNRAQLGGSLAGESTTCTGAPAVVIGKSASGPTPTGNPNEYRLTYLVNVQNNGTLPGNYDLADTFTFAGVNVVSVGAVQHGGSDPLATALGTLGAAGGTIVTGESIAAGADENYTYSVVFTIDDVAAIGTCANGGGLKNHAALGGSSAGQVETCSDVPDVTVTKSASGPTPTGTPNQYAIVYTVAVDNGGGAEGSYDLADAFAFAGATIDAVSAVTHAGPDPLATALGTLGTSGGSIVTAETIAAAGSESYTYTVTFTLTDADLADDCANPNGGLRNTAALGGSAAGDARTCTGTPLLAIAKALTGESGSAAGVAEAGEQLTYTITLSNSGSSDALDQSITDRLDPNVTFVSADNGGTLVGGNVQWTGLSVPAGGSLALTVTVRVADPIPAGVTQIGNVAYDPSIGPPDCSTTPQPPNCTSTPTPSVVTIVKALAGESGALPGVAEPGEQLTYTITLSNTGGSDATGYGVTDALDPNTGFVSADNGGVHAAGVVTWSNLTVPANGSLVLTVVVQVADPLPAGVEQIANVAYETGTTPPTCPPAGGQCVVIPTEGAVVIAKTLSGESGSLGGVAEPGEQLTYTITLTNTGGSAVSGYAVSDRLDPNTLFVSASDGGAFAAGVVNWSGLAIPANGTLSLTVVVQVVDPIPAGVTQIGNVAYETGTTPPSCPPAGGQCVVTPTAGAVTIVKSVADASGDGLAQPGEQLTYTIALTNTGGSAVTDYAVTDPLDANTRFVSADNGGVHVAGVVNWSGLTVPANGTLSLTLVVQVNDPLPAGVSLIGNVAYQTGTTPPNCNDKGRPPSCVDIEVPPQTGVPQLSITKTASSAVLQPGGTVVYTITVRNVGTADASDVVVSDPIPAGIDAYAWTCAATGVVCPNASGSGAITEQIASFPIGASVVYTVSATLSANPPATVNNTATVTPGGIATCADGTTPPCPATAIGTVVQPQAPLPVPTVHVWAQLLIALSLFGLAWRRRRS
ncbi:hypothetical protein [Dokdonella sp.]|uniref:DUF7933 domain-containing protein n=1 Tax=Dokdonella sp. TaxID=2291710 RepID=UPI001B067AEC|nr:hypothetical protein [Dokdonella sp.]MBO9664654.1 DUF11 domain-containing protein [Dokdonella sp.]